VLRAFPERKGKAMKLWMPPKWEPQVNINVILKLYAQTIHRKKEATDFTGVSHQ
jgi:hypothetical protein